jgi:hypothetical protein
LFSHVKIGDLLAALDRRDEALAAYQDGLAIARKLAASDTGNAGWQTDLAFCLAKVSTVSDPPRTRAALTEALAIAETLARDGKPTAAQQMLLKHIRDRLAELPPEQAEAR